MKTFANILKSKIDERIYKGIQLPNNLACILISDRNTEKSACQLSVGVGSFQNPKEY